MNVEKLQNIISKLNNYCESDWQDFLYFEEVCQELNVPFDRWNDDADYLNETISKVMTNIINMIENDDNMKSFLYINVSPIFLTYLPSSPEMDNAIMQYVDSITDPDDELENILWFMKSLTPEKQLELFKSNHRFGAYIDINIISENTTPEEKKLFIEKHHEEIWDRDLVELIKSLENDSDKEKFLSDIENIEWKKEIISTFKDNDKKVDVYLTFFRNGC